LRYCLPSPLQGYNHKALATLDEALAAMRGLQMTSGTFRSGVLLKLCNANSQIKRHEEALQFCDQALQLRQPVAAAAGSPPSSSAFADPSAVREALVVRAEALARDADHDEAVRDWAKALELAEAHGAGQDAVMDLRRRLQSANQVAPQSSTS
jgi:tetratricopeptide (TPR) repeat protein